MPRPRSRHPLPRSRRSLLRRAALGAAAWAGLTTLVACDDAPRPAPARRSAPAAPSAPAVTETPAAPSGWRREAGPVLLVAWPSAAAASVITPEAQGLVEEGVDVADTTAFMRAPLTLLDRAGRAHSARFGGWVDPSSFEGCSPWPVVRPVDATGSTPAWTVGFAGARTTPVPLDSLGAMTRADSATIAVEASRLASIAPRPVSASFRGLPFSVKEAYRFEAAPGVQALAVLLVRTVNQEDMPLQERTFIVAERDSGQTSGHFTLAYDERTSGPEETIETLDLLAALRVGSGPLALVVARDYGGTQSFSLLEREGAKRWRVRWRSARMECQDL